jgi:transposase
LLSKPRWDQDSWQWIALEQQIESDSLVRQISDLIDQDLFQLADVCDLYSGRGSAAVDPQLLLKLAVFEHCRGRTKPIEWYRDLSTNIEAQWLTFGMTVSKTTLYSFRDRVEPLLHQWNDQLVHYAVEQELIAGRRASLDGTAVAANASRRKLVNMRQIDRRLSLLEQALAESTQVLLVWTVTTLDASLVPGWMAPTEAGKRAQHQRYLKVKQRLALMLEENSRRRKDKQKPVDKIVVSVTDSESVFGRDKEKVYRPLYNVQTLSDVGSDMVLAYEVFAQHADNGTLQSMVHRSEIAGARLDVLLVDAGYPTGEDLAFCEQHGIILYGPWQENSFTKTKKKSAPCEAPIEKAQFTWDTQRESYFCPTGRELPFSHQKTRQRADGRTIRFDVYQASGSDCVNCDRQSRCTKAPEKGRTVRRDRHQEQIDELQTRMETVEAKLLYRLRGQTIERVFGDFKEHRNLRRFRGRGIRRARAQLGLTVLGHNLRIIHKLRQSKIPEPINENQAKNPA